MKHAVNKVLVLVAACCVQIAFAQGYASSGTGSGVHLATELFLERAAIRVLGVPYKGTGPALNDTVAGHVQMPSAFCAVALVSSL